MLGKDPVSYVLMKSIFERIIKQSMILLHFYRILEVLRINKWTRDIDRKASHVWELKKIQIIMKTKIWKFWS